MGDDELSDWPDYDEDRPNRGEGWSRHSSTCAYIRFNLIFTCVFIASLNFSDGRDDSALTMSADLHDSNAMSVEDASLTRRRSLDICKISSKTPLSSDSATTIVQGIMLRGFYLCGMPVVQRIMPPCSLLMVSALIGC